MRANNESRVLRSGSLHFTLLYLVVVFLLIHSQPTFNLCTEKRLWRLCAADGEDLNVWLEGLQSYWNLEHFHSSVVRVMTRFSRPDPPSLLHRDDDDDENSKQQRLEVIDDSAEVLIC